MKSVLFDLDNTLYSERTYVESGFKYISAYLSKKYDFIFDEVYSLVLDIFEKKGRGLVFNETLEKLDIYSETNLKTLIYLYRFHIPEIKFYDDSLESLQILKKDFKLGLITDGRVFVQKRKVEALNIENLFDTIIFTDILGSENWKPSKVPYEIALNLLNSNPEESVYIGDDPFKDFNAPKLLNMDSIQIKKEEVIDYWAKRGYKKVEPDYEINSLNEIYNLKGLNIFK